MIDTDKYKGHTPVRKEWPRWCEDWLFSVYSDDGSHIPNWNQDNNLACDAPLILQAYEEKCKEVKRLQKENQRYLDFIFWLGIEHKGKELAWEYGDEKLVEMIE